MPSFMLLLEEQPGGFEKLSPEEMQKALEKYMAWGKHPFVTAGHRLAHDGGKVMRSGTPGKIETTDGPYAEAKEFLGGIYLIEAADYNQAVERTLDHPHLAFGQTIKVRQLFGCA